MKKYVICLALAGVAAGCSSKASKIEAQYVSPLQYATYGCPQLGLEYARISRRVAEISGQQDKAASRDTAAVAVGVVLFWPALFFLAGKDHSAELGRLKGEAEAVERIAIERECALADQIAEAQQQAAEREEADEAQALYDEGM